MQLKIKTSTFALVCIIILANLQLTVAQSLAATIPDINGEIQILFSYENKEAIAVLVDNPTSQSLLKQLPLTVNFSDYAGAEKIASFPTKLSRETNVTSYDPELWDLSSYGPWGNLVIFYKDQPYANGLIYIGKFKSGIDNLTNLNGEVKIKQITQ